MLEHPERWRTTQLPDANHPTFYTDHCQAAPDRSVDQARGSQWREVSPSIFSFRDAPYGAPFGEISQKRWNVAA